MNAYILPPDETKSISSYTRTSNYTGIYDEVSLTQSPLALRKTRILAMNPAKWLQT